MILESAVFINSLLRKIYNLREREKYVPIVYCAANGSKYCYILCSHVPNRLLLLLFLFVYNKRVGFEIIVIILIIVSISSANQLNIGKRIVSLK